MGDGRTEKEETPEVEPKGETRPEGTFVRCTNQACKGTLFLLATQFSARAKPAATTYPYALVCAYCGTKQYFYDTAEESA